MAGHFLCLFRKKSRAKSFKREELVHKHAQKVGPAIKTEQRSSDYSTHTNTHTVSSLFAKVSMTIVNSFFFFLIAASKFTSRHFGVQ